MALCRFTPRQLEAFIAVHEARGFGAAAQRLALTPSAISQLVAELEDTVGLRLFDRTTRSVALTTAGQGFVAPAAAVLAQLAAAERVADGLRRSAAGQVCVAAPQVLAATLLPLAIAQFARSHPQMQVALRDAPVDHLVQAVASGDADLALGPDLAPGDAVACQPLFDSPWVLWCAPGHALAQQDTVPWPALRPHRVVAAGRDHERHVPAMAPGLPAGAVVAANDVVDHVTTALGLAASGLAVTLAPAYVGALARPMGLVMRRVVGPEATRQVCLYRPLRRNASAAADAFAQHLALWLQDTGNTTFTCPVPDATK